MIQNNRISKNLIKYLKLLYFESLFQFFFLHVKHLNDIFKQSCISLKPTDTRMFRSPDEFVDISLLLQCLSPLKGQDFSEISRRPNINPKNMISKKKCITRSQCCLIKSNFFLNVIMTTKWNTFSKLAPTKFKICGRIDVYFIANSTCNNFAPVNRFCILIIQLFCVLCILKREIQLFHFFIS